MKKIANSTCGLTVSPKKYRTSSEKYADDKVEQPDRIVCPLEVDRGIVVQSKGKRNALLLLLIQEIDIAPFQGIGGKSM